MLMIIYVAMKISTTLTLRELMNMIIAVKETHLLSQLEGISKTKIRGVLAVLKHGQLFLTNDEAGEAVQLCFNHCIQCFKDLREQHDSFINQWMLLNHPFLPINLKSDIIWHLDIETKALRLEELKTLEARIKYFFLSGGHIPYKTFPSVETSTSSERLYSESSSSGLPWTFASETSSRVQYEPNSISTASVARVPLLTKENTSESSGWLPTKNVPPGSSVMSSERYHLRSNSRFSNYNHTGDTLPFPPTSFPYSASLLKFPSQALPVQRETSGGSTGSDVSGSGAAAYLSRVSTSSSAAELVQRNNSGASADGNDGVGNADGRERSLSYTSEGNSVFYDRRNRIDPRVSVSATPLFYEVSTVSGHNSSKVPLVPHDYQFQQPLVQQPIRSYAETYYDSVALSSTLSSNDSYNQLPQQFQTGYFEEYPYSYDGQQQPQQQSTLYPRSDQYSPISDTFYNSQEPRQLVNPVTGLPLLNPPIGGFMNRHYRPNRNKNASGSIPNTVSSNNSDNDTKDHICSDTPDGLGETRQTDGKSQF
jgi:hypothetical protein